MSFQPEYSNFIKAEILRLDAGNADEKRRAQTFRSKVSAVCATPYSPTYSKNLPDNYGAVAVTARYRLFFKVHQEHNVVFFAWMNDENHLHTSGATNDSYQEFRRKLNNQEIEIYSHILTIGEQFIFNGSWGNDYIYVEFNRILSNEETEYSRSSLTLNQISTTEYAISSIDVSTENNHLASELLKRSLLRADEQGITITFELFLKTQNLDKSRHLLFKFGFQMSMADLDTELWIRHPLHP